MPGRLRHSPADVLRQLMIDLDLGTDPDDEEDWPIFCSLTPDAPDALISTWNTTPVQHGRAMVGGEVQKIHGAMIWLRAKDDPTVQDKANAVLIALTQQVSFDEVICPAVGDIPASTYVVKNVNLASGPIAVGKEPTSSRDVVTINVLVSVRQLS